MLKTEIKAAYSLAMVYGLRMIGLFMVLPVFSLYAGEYEDATPLLIGLAIGIYGLTQGLFQLPFGFLSDRFGRKPVIVAGLLIFCAGSIVAAQADSIMMIVVGRALQGLGAIAAAVMALAADLTREQVRLRIMALIGMSIGVSFMLSMLLGPLLVSEYGLSGLFWLAAVFALVGIAIILWVTPTPVDSKFHRDTQVSMADVGRVFANRELLKLGFSIYSLHLMLSATFAVFPLVLSYDLLVDVGDHWKTYLPVFLLSAVFLVPMIIVAEKYGRARFIFLFSLGLMILAEVGLASVSEYWMAFAILVIFFSAINILEAVLPATVSRIAPADMKGTAMGLFSAAQFIGVFSGGLIGGLLIGAESLASGFYWLAAVGCLWFLVAMTIRMPKQTASKLVPLHGLDESRLQNFCRQVGSLKGVEEVAIYREDGVAYLKVSKEFEQSRLDELTATS